MDKLKPCPFCGGKAELIIVPGYFKSGLSSSGWLVKCIKGCCNQNPYTSDHDAAEAWNRRAELTDLELDEKLQKKYNEGFMDGQDYAVSVM